MDPLAKTFLFSTAIRSVTIKELILNVPYIALGSIRITNWVIQYDNRIVFGKSDNYVTYNVL